MMILQDEMLRASRRFEASGRPVLLEARREMTHAGRQDEAGTAEPPKTRGGFAASPSSVRGTLAILRFWLVRQPAT